MPLRKAKRVLAAVCALLLFGTLNCHAQFRDEAFSQKYNDDGAVKPGEEDKIFDFQEFWGGLTHKRTASVQTMTEGSAILIGGLQIYNKDYWKLPIVYGGIATGLAGGIYYGTQGNTKMQTASFILAGATYWASLMDGVISYSPHDYPNAGKATIYSLLLPGLGQAYNNEFWKLPVYLGALGSAYHFYDLFNGNYKRFQQILINKEFDQVSEQSAKYYRDTYRRYKEYSVLAMAAVYLLQVIDANVFAFMHNFEVTEDLAITCSPAIIPSTMSFSAPSNAAGLNISIRF